MGCGIFKIQDMVLALLHGLKFNWNNLESNEKVKQEEERSQEEQKCQQDLELFRISGEVEKGDSSPGIARLKIYRRVALRIFRNRVSLWGSKQRKPINKFKKFQLFHFNYFQEGDIFMLIRELNALIKWVFIPIYLKFYFL